MQNDQSKQGHTPGPWGISSAMNDYTGAIIGNGDRAIAETCTIDSVDVTEEEEANARLIAAAPELLEALECAIIDLEDIIPELGLNGEPHPSWRTITQARAAIAKARG